MATSTANSVPFAELAEMCHQYYALGKQIVDKALILGVSNTVLNGICVEVKGIRPTVNTLHTAILAQLANN